MPHPRPIPWLIVLLGVGFTAFTAWSFYRAAIGTSNVTDADYYSHGLRYNQTLLERQAAASLGWQAEPQLSGKHLNIRLRDRDQQAVTGARGTLTLLGPGTPGTRELGLLETGDGIYRAEFPAGVKGEQPIEITFQRDGARLSRRLLLAID